MKILKCSEEKGYCGKGCLIQVIIIIIIIIINLFYP
jgi:hypothetical protein